MKTTLNELAQINFQDGFMNALGEFLGKGYPQGSPISYRGIATDCGVDSTLATLSQMPGYDREKRLFAVSCALKSEHLLNGPALLALHTARRFAYGIASQQELNSAAAQVQKTSVDPDTFVDNESKERAQKAMDFAINAVQHACGSGRHSFYLSVRASVYARAGSIGLNPAWSETRQRFLEMVSDVENGQDSFEGLGRLLPAEELDSLFEQECSAPQP